jgi:hypothetical protein
MHGVGCMQGLTVRRTHLGETKASSDMIWLLGVRNALRPRQLEGGLYGARNIL